VSSEKGVAGGVHGCENQALCAREVCEVVDSIAGGLRIRSRAMEVRRVGGGGGIM
jgi:hypothetical protein